MHLRMHDLWKKVHGAIVVIIIIIALYMYPYSCCMMHLIGYVFTYSCFPYRLESLGDLKRTQALHVMPGACYILDLNRSHWTWEFWTSKSPEVLMPRWGREWVSRKVEGTNSFQNMILFTTVYWPRSKISSDSPGIQTADVKDLYTLQTSHDGVSPAI